MTGGSEWFGDPHTITVTSVRLPDGPLDDGELEYEVEHLPSCGEEEHSNHGMTWTEPACELAWWLREISLAETLRYAGTPITEPGTYRIQSWGRKYYVPDYGAYEHDGGVGLVVDDEPAEAGR